MYMGLDIAKIRELEEEQMGPIRAQREYDAIQLAGLYTKSANK
eukprot:CAMPEP_0117017266 /NCGR_PEP_ID=MMETSP0472-20121206/13511_1 /TAXON_ID=693140 ORGANISM="Tiarina fusus, Strain LIS" /NCGR_SAMPLE_ID=MMETSP0472 /ASSEMBLY_ACC=CAM_ASM_000603 /LENGTH=42 /DNA_ID= /DNA_START= /DNA_END= /DNA_ORIENTATION=